MAPPAADALAHLDQMIRFTPLAPRPGSSSVATLTLTPPGGFLRVHADHPMWFLEDMHAEQSHQWVSSYSTALVIVPYGFSYFDVENPRIAPPLAITDIRHPNQPPLTYLLYNLTPAARQALLRQSCISTAELTFFVYNLGWEIPRYLCTVSGFTSSDSDELRDIIIACLSEDTSIQVLIDIFSGDESAISRAFTVLNSLEVTVLDLRGPGGYPAPAANLYMDAPSPDFEQWQMWRNHVYCQLFPMNFIGYDQGHPGWRCSGCHASDHPRGLCPFPRLPGWRGPGLNNSGTPDENDESASDNNGAGPSSSHSNGPPSRGCPAGSRGRGRGRF
ncbi:hypothetical protein BKA93DRAFT_831276 [Sparassis latifolia]